MRGLPACRRHRRAGLSGQELKGSLGLALDGVPGEDQAIGEVDLAREVGAGLVPEPAGRSLGLGQDPFAVEHQEGLRGDRRTTSFHAVDRHPGCIEGVDHGQGLRAPVEHVDAPAAVLGSVLGHDLPLGVDHDLGGRAVHRQVQRPGDRQDRVVDRFRVEPAEREPAQQFVARVGGSQLGRLARRLAIGGRGHDQGVERLDAPPLADEFGREPVEQLRMGWGHARTAEVVRGGDDPVAEVLLPDPVDEDPRGQGMIGPGEPAREGEPPPRAGSSRPGWGNRQRGCAPGEDLGDVGEHLAPAVVGLAPFQEVVRIGFRLRVGQGPDPGKQDLFGLELGDLVPPARRLLLVFGERGQELFVLGLEMAAEFLVEVFLDRAPFWLRELEGDLDVAPDRLGELVELLLVEAGFERLGERLDLGLDGGDLAIDRVVRGLRGVALGLVAELEQPLLRDPPVERGVRGGEDGGDRVVVFVADRVVLVAVAAGAAERETEQRRVNDLDRVGEDLARSGGKLWTGRSVGSTQVRRKPVAIRLSARAGVNSLACKKSSSSSPASCSSRNRLYGLSELRARMT